MASRKSVPASAVRKWVKDNSPEGVPVPGVRGRIPAATVKAFHKANPRLRYEQASEAEKPTVTVPVTKVDKKGRRYTRPQTITTEAARAALGHEKGRRGRFDMKALSEALSEV